MFNPRQLTPFGPRQMTPLGPRQVDAKPSFTRITSELPSLGPIACLDRRGICGGSGGVTESRADAAGKGGVTGRAASYRPSVTAHTTSGVTALTRARGGQAAPCRSARSARVRRQYGISAASRHLRHVAHSGECFGLGQRRRSRLHRVSPLQRYRSTTRHKPRRCTCCTGTLTRVPRSAQERRKLAPRRLLWRSDRAPAASGALWLGEFEARNSTCFPRRCKRGPWQTCGKLGSKPCTQAWPATIPVGMLRRYGPGERGARCPSDTGVCRARPCSNRQLDEIELRPTENGSASAQEGRRTPGPRIERASGGASLSTSGHDAALAPDRVSAGRRACRALNAATATLSDRAGGPGALSGDQTRRRVTRVAPYVRAGVRRCVMLGSCGCAH